MSDNKAKIQENINNKRQPSSLLARLLEITTLNISINYSQARLMNYKLPNFREMPIGISCRQCD